MAYGDYIHCAQCAETNGLGHKLIYDGYHSTREILEERFGEDYEILCPMCIASLRSRITELERERDEAVDKAIRFDLDAAGITQREAESRELIELRAEVARLREMVAQKIEQLALAAKQEPNWREPFWKALSELRAALGEEGK